MTETDNGDSNGGLSPCACDDPEPAPDDDPRACPDCGGFIMGAIIGGEVHAGYSTLGNGQAFFEVKESWHLNSGDSGGINTHDDGEWFRSFASATVVVPHHTEQARTLGTRSLSFDHVVHGDGEVELIVDNRRTEDLPGGPKFPVQTNDVSPPE